MKIDKEVWEIIEQACKGQGLDLEEYTNGHMEILAILNAPKVKVSQSILCLLDAVSAMAKFLVVFPTNPASFRESNPGIVISEVITLLAKGFPDLLTLEVSHRMQKMLAEGEAPEAINQQNQIIDSIEKGLKDYDEDDLTED